MFDDLSDASVSVDQAMRSDDSCMRRERSVPDPEDSDVTDLTCSRQEALAELSEQSLTVRELGVSPHVMACQAKINRDAGYQPNAVDSMLFAPTDVNVADTEILSRSVNDVTSCWESGGLSRFRG